MVGLEPIDRRGLVMAAMAAAGQACTFTPVQVQKLFFLIDREAASLVGGPHFRFVPYDYGPFDHEVYQELEALATLGHLEIGTQGRFRQYVLTQAGFSQAVELLATLSPAAREYLQNATTWVRSLNFQQLVSSIYERYPDMRENSVFRS
jgi:uncharacterized protein